MKNKLKLLSTISFLSMFSCSILWASSESLDELENNYEHLNLISSSIFLNEYTYGILQDKSKKLARIREKIDKIYTNGDTKVYVKALRAQNPESNFKVIKKLEPEEQNLSYPCNYVINYHKEELENISGIPAKDFMTMVGIYGLKYILFRFYQTVKIPQEGDLAFYSKGIDDKGGRFHVGLYREDDQTIELWMKIFDNPYIFTNNFFFVPESFGNTIEFYRVKSELPELDLLNVSQMYNLNSKFFAEFDKKCEEGILIRDNISNTLNGNFDDIKEIKKIPHINFPGVCFNYAFGKIFKTYHTPRGLPAFGSNKKALFSKIDKYFIDVTEEPLEGDLVIYFSGQNLINCEHFGIYLGNGFVESKWGVTDVYQHPLFYVDNTYGDYVKYYRLNSEREEVIEELYRELINKNNTVAKANTRTSSSPSYFDYSSDSSDTSSDSSDISIDLI